MFRKCFYLSFLVLMTVWSVQGFSADKTEDGFVSIFDGKTLKGWDGNPEIWSVEDGCITGITSDEKPLKSNTFIIWRDGETKDFILKLDYKIINGNSGIQYRSFEVDEPKWTIGGYQADFEAGKNYSGILYGEKFRGILGLRGEKTVIGKNHKPTVVGSVGDSDEIQSKIKHEDWNSYTVIAKGNHFVHKINGMVTVDVTDNDVEKRRSSGLLALQAHVGPAMKVQFKNVRIKHLAPKKKSKAVKNAIKKIVFIAGKKSHGYGSHEHYAGCKILADALREQYPNYDISVIKDGWPSNTDLLKGATTVVVYSDGGGNHPLMKHLSEFDELFKNGTGLVCIHYAVEITKGNPGDKLKDWTGGYFETDWSVNPHWTAEYNQLPDHEIARGVKPFTIHDEWYYNMRFREKMRNVQPILTAVPPKHTLSRPDGPHSGNPQVRAMIGQPQHLAWASETEDGVRGFGFTGGHFHWNWGNDDFRKLVLNAIAWTSHENVPETGISSRSLSVSDLEANQDYKKSSNHNPARIQKMLDQWNSASKK